MEKTRDDSHKKKHQDSTPRPISGTTSMPNHREPNVTPILTAVELPLGITQTTTVVPNAENFQRTLLTTPHQTVPIVDNTIPPKAPNKEREFHAETEALAVDEDAPELILNNFVSQHYETLTSLMRGEAKRRSSHSLQNRLNFDQ